MYVCSLCGEPIEELDQVIVVHQAQVRLNASGGLKLVETRLENGLLKVVMHLLCPVEFGAPLAVIGAERGPDV